MKKITWIISSCLVLWLTLTTALANDQSIVNVKFPNKSNTATYTGTIKGRHYIDYRFKANQGQTLNITLKRLRGDYPYFNIITTKSEVAISDDAHETTHWLGQLPTSQTYVARVYIAKAGRLAGRTSHFKISFVLK